MVYELSDNRIVNPIERMINPITTIYGNEPTAAYVDSMTPSNGLSRAIEALESNQHALAYNVFDNVFPGISGRTEYNRSHYEHFRPGEALPKKYKDVVETINNVYSTLSIVRNIIDLMSDFGCDGIKVVHPVASIEKFYQDWFKKVNGLDRSERFLSGIYRHGMVVIREMKGTVPNKKIQDLISNAASDIKLKQIPTKQKEIPLKYVFYNPARFVHENYHDINADPQYKLYKPKNIYTEDIFHDKIFFDDKPEVISPEKLYVAYYKKDDWNARPIPFMYPIIKHAIMLEKLALADSSALDGLISKVRIFKLGDKEKKLFPTPNLISKLDQLMRSNVSGGTIDIIWGPDIELIESETDIHQVLGNEKFQYYLNQVYEGLGIPSSFVGAGQGTTNNYISLKILTRRLCSGRERLVEFWNTQMKKVQLAMGFNEPAHLEFNNLDLGDEESERNLLIQLLDREIVSEERVLNLLGFDPRMENKRIRKESTQRKNKKRPQKAGQFHINDQDFILRKTSLERGHMSPEQVGVPFIEGTENDKSPNDEEREMQAKNPNPTKVDSNKGGGGRPRGAKDSTKRQTKTFKPSIKAAIDSWVLSAQNEIASIIGPVALSTLNKKNKRQLTTSEYQAIDQLQFNILLNIEPMSKIDKDVVLSYIDLPISNETMGEYQSSLEEMKSFINRAPSVEECKIIQRAIYTEKYYENI